MHIVSIFKKVFNNCHPPLFYHTQLMGVRRKTRSTALVYPSLFKHPLVRVTVPNPKASMRNQNILLYHRIFYFWRVFLQCKAEWEHSFKVTSIQLQDILRHRLSFPSRSMLSKMVATRHMWLLNTSNVASVNQDVQEGQNRHQDVKL